MVTQLGNVPIPNSARTGKPGQFATKNGNNMPILQFGDNEAYGAMQVDLRCGGSAARIDSYSSDGERHQESDHLNTYTSPCAPC